MTLFELFVIAIGLSMDAFAVAICKGLSVKKMNGKHAVLVGAYFGGFQAGMPLLGFFLGRQFSGAIQTFDHWIAFLLLGAIGVNMIKESRNDSCEIETNKDNSFHFKTMSMLAIATSIDALAVGVMFAFLSVSIVPAVSFIGIVTFTLSVIGVKIGNVFGEKFKSRAELAGGCILVCMGVKILFDHLEIVSKVTAMF